MAHYTPVPERDDVVLGRLRLCRACGEEWPRDEEFWFFDRRGKVVGYCRACWSERRKAERVAAKYSA